MGHDPSYAILPVILCVCFSPAAEAATQEDVGLQLRADTRVVQIDVTVRDAQGKTIEGLKKSDFTITDNGKPRQFTIFGASRKPDAGQPEAAVVLPARESLPPNVFTNVGQPAPVPEGHSTIILLDGINGWFENFVWARKGVIGLMNKIPADEKIAVYAIYTFSGMQVVQDYTPDRQRVIDVMSTLIPQGMEPGPPDMEAPMAAMTDSGDQGGGAARDYSKQPARERQHFLNAGSDDVRRSLSAFAANLKNVPGRKTVFWVTQGFPPTQLRGMNQDAWDKTFSALNDANVAVNPVDSNGVGGPPRKWGSGAILSMMQVADRTGGHAFYGRNDIDGALADGINEARNSYTLGFYLGEVDGHYHELKVRVNRPGVQLNYRQGYYSQSEPKTDSSQKKAEMRSVLLNPINSTAVGITASVGMTAGAPRDTLNVRLKLTPNSLSVKQLAGRWTGKVEELFLQLNADGREVGRQSDTRQFSVATEGKAAYDAAGVTLPQAMPMMPGAVKLSIIVRDIASGRVGSLVIPLDGLVQLR